MNSTDIAWNLTDLKNIPKRNVKVMSTFACGGGSSMGYKLAGCEIVAANDIDPDMMYHYKLNNNVPHFIKAPIEDLKLCNLPDECYELDIFDGSPPCSTFSMAGNREKDWGKEKHFREGQAKQVLSDLFFDYLDVVERLKPKVAIAENVKGMIAGKAKGYCKEIMARFREIGYRPQLFLINAADCGVPQRRERVFFCAVREDVSDKQLEMKPRHRWISAAEAVHDLSPLTKNEIENTKFKDDSIHKKFWHLCKPGMSYQHLAQKIDGNSNSFNSMRIASSKPAPTLTAVGHNTCHWSEPRRLTFREWKRLGSFPDDYKARAEGIGKYMVGMSVPPKMVKVVADAVISQWLGK